MNPKFTLQNDTAVLQLTGDLNVVKVEKLRESVSTWLQANPSVKYLVMDLSEVAMIDSAGLGLLIAFLKLLRERGGDLNLAGLQKRVRLVFDITRTKRIFGIYDTVSEAKAGFPSRE